MMSDELQLTTLAVKVSNVVLWSIIETGIAIIVGSIPSLKPLVKSIPFFGTHHSRSGRKSRNPQSDFQSFGLRSTAPYNHNTQIILVRSEVQVEEASRPTTGCKSFKSFTF
jgi:hypothetical protein